MSKIEVDKVDPQSGTALEIGTSGDTVTVPSGVGLTLTDSTLLLPTTITSTTEVKTNKISPATGTAFALGDSGDTFTVPSGATFANLGTATGFAAISWQAVTTGSTLTAVAGNGYPINTTSNTCTITLPGSASVGDQITFQGSNFGGAGTVVLTLTSANLFSGSTQGFTNFELHNSERTEVILKILLYAGVVIRDPQIIQVAAQKVQQEEVNEKS